MISTICQTCDNTGQIFRPITTSYEGVWLDGHTVFVNTTAGGLDACPECAAKANSHWELCCAD